MIINNSRNLVISSQFLEFFNKEYKRDHQWNKKLIIYPAKFDLLSKISSNSIVSKYQWQYASNNLYNFLDHNIFLLFLLKVLQHVSKIK